MDILYKEEAYKIIGACMEVHKHLGCGFLEPVYQDALEKEFMYQNLPYLREMVLPIYYKQQRLNKYYQAGFVCYDKIIVELKALSELTSQHEAQVLNYLKATGFKLGLLINFGQTSLQYKRIIKSNNPR